VELGLVFVVLPILLAVERAIFARLIIPLLLVVAGGCLVVLLRDPAFDRARLGLGAGRTADLVRPVLVFVVAGGMLTLGIALLRPELFLALPRHRPGLWLLVVVLYPVLSVYPQELIFRTYLFHRSQGLLRRPWQAVVASALVFGLAHLLLGNWIAPVMCILGGLLFARTYQRTGSTLVACLEHALWGDLVFTIGLGRFFYGGAG
jgi:membrane protease YdiL (CAAX protease family)